MSTFGPKRRHKCGHENGNTTRKNARWTKPRQNLNKYKYKYKYIIIM